MRAKCLLSLCAPPGRQPKHPQLGQGQARGQKQGLKIRDFGGVVFLCSQAPTQVVGAPSLRDGAVLNTTTLYIDSSHLSRVWQGPRHSTTVHAASCSPFRPPFIDTPTNKPHDPQLVGNLKVLFFSSNAPCPLLLILFHPPRRNHRGRIITFLKKIKPCHIRYIGAPLPPLSMEA